MTIKRPLILDEIVEDFRSIYNGTANKVAEVIADIEDEFKSDIEQVTTEVKTLTPEVTDIETKVEPLVDLAKTEEAALTEATSIPEEE